MACDFSARIDKHFASLTDPRRGKVTYPLINIVAIALCATIAGADDFVAIADWARQKRDWLGQFLDLSSGIPSHDRFNAIFRALKPEPFERCLVSWITALHEVTAGQLVAIDGKTMRQSFDKADRQVGPPHGQRLGHRQQDQPGPGGRRREEQRDHRHPRAARAAGAARERW